MLLLNHALENEQTNTRFRFFELDFFCIFRCLTVLVHLLFWLLDVAIYLLKMITFWSQYFKVSFHFFNDTTHTLICNHINHVILYSFNHLTLSFVYTCIYWWTNSRLPVITSVCRWIGNKWSLLLTSLIQVYIPTEVTCI